MYKGSSLSTSSPTLACLADYSHPSQCEVILHCGFSLYFCNDYRCWTSFQCVGFSFCYWVMRCFGFFLSNIYIYSGYLCMTSLDCCNKFLKVGWLKTNLLSHASGSEVWDQGVSRTTLCVTVIGEKGFFLLALGISWQSLAFLGSQMYHSSHMALVSACLHVISPPSVSVPVSELPPFQKDISHTG